MNRRGLIGTISVGITMGLAGCTESGYLDDNPDTGDENVRNDAGNSEDNQSSDYETGTNEENYTEFNNTNNSNQSWDTGDANNTDSGEWDTGDANNTDSGE